MLFPKNLGKLRIIRSISLLACLLIGIDGISSMGVVRFYRFFTQWGLTYCALFFLATSIYPFLLSPKRNHAVLERIYTVAFEVGWMTEWLVSAGFWIVIFPCLLVFKDARSKFSSIGFESIMYNLTVHTLPIIGMVLEYKCGLVLFKKYDFLNGFSFVLCYAFYDCILTYLGYGEAYPVVLTWDNYISMITITVFILMSLLAFVIGYRLKHREGSAVSNELKDS